MRLPSLTKAFILGLVLALWTVVAGGRTVAGETASPVGSEDGQQVLTIVYTHSANGVLRSCG